MKTVLMVDGYNIINSWPELVKLKHKTLEEARARLMDIMANYASFTGQRVIVVFDAHQVKGASGYRDTLDGIEVIFSREGETADEVIERMVGEYTGLKGCEVYVATSDWIEQRIVFGKGAYRVTARELYNDVEKMYIKMKEWGGDEPGPERFLGNRLSDKVRRLLDIKRKK